MEVTRDLACLLRDRWVAARKYLKQPLPLILHEEVYSYFGEWCKIIEANVYDKIENAEVTVENRSGMQSRVEFSELSWRQNWDMVNGASEKSMVELIVEGP